MELLIWTRKPSNNRLQENQKLMVKLLFQSCKVALKSSRTTSGQFHRDFYMSNALITVRLWSDHGATLSVTLRMTFTYERLSQSDFHPKMGFSCNPSLIRGLPGDGSLARRKREGEAWACFVCHRPGYRLMSGSNLWSSKTPSKLSETVASIGW